ncbi:MAG TPA: DUF1576 domain-containing protein [Bacilli bacterium]|nr:DUF1576 domain-containing protein [Bacilli bacterium]
MKAWYRNFESRYLIILSILIMVGLAFVIDTPSNIGNGLINIYTSPGLLVTDFLAVGGIGATILNVAIILAFNFGLIHVLNIKYTGPVFAGIFTIAGFAFFGKTLLNTLPIYAGIYLYSLYSKVEFKNYIIVALLSTGIGPIVSFIMFGMGLEYYYSIPLAIVTGLAVGFILQIVATNAMKFHKGYNLYNIGFTLGLLAMLFTGLFSRLSIPLNTQTMINNNYHNHLFLFALVISIYCIVFAFANDINVLKKYPRLLKSTGRLVTDFVRETSQPEVMLNIGLLGILCLLFSVILQIPINGPIFGGIMTVMGFGAFGKHIKNVLPVMVGTLVAAWVFKLDIKTSVGVGLGFYFVTALAPVAGQYGIVAGLLAGFLHMIVLPMAMNFQGGFDLYNNGFAAGFVAAVLVPIFEIFQLKGEEDHVTTRN